MPAKKDVRKSKPARDPLAREKQLEQLAVNLAEKQLIEGTASAAVITHYLKLASTREVAERDILHSKAELMKAKADSIKSNKRSEELAGEAVSAMKAYSGSSNADNHE